MDNKSTRLTNVSIGMGGALIITIFVVLCLTVLSALSFTTAYSDLKLVNKTEEFNKDYYNVHGMAEEKLAEINTALMSLAETIPQMDDFLRSAADEVSKIPGVSVTQFDNSSFTLYYEVLGEKNQKLCATIDVIFKENQVPVYNIATWNLETIVPPTYEEENYQLWEGFE
jgi:hypothetical protein